MNKFSFIDHENRDFLRNEKGEVIIMEFSDYMLAEDWLLSNGEKFGWTNTGVHYYNWDEQFSE